VGSLNLRFPLILFKEIFATPPYVYMHMQMFCVNMTFKNAFFFPVHFGCGIVFVYRGWERALQWEPAIAQPPRGP